MTRPVPPALKAADLTWKEAYQLHSALYLVARRIEARALSFNNRFNRSVELNRASRIRQCGENLLRNPNSDSIRHAILEYQRNVGVAPDGRIEIGRVIEPTSAMNPLIREMLGAFHGPPGNIWMDGSYRVSIAGRVKAMTSPVPLPGSDKEFALFIKRLGEDHPMVIEALALATKTEQQFIRANVLASQELGTSLLHILTVYRMETANTFGTGHYENVGTVGLINWTLPGTLVHKDVISGTVSPEKFLVKLSTLSRSDQVSSVVEYLQAWREAAFNYSTLARVYLAVLNLTALSEYRQKRLNGVVFSIAQNRIFYEANSGLDANRNGVITVGEVMSCIFRHREHLLLATKEHLMELVNGSYLM